MEWIDVEDSGDAKRLHFITTKPSGEETGDLHEEAEVDIDIGDTCDFEVRVPSKVWKAEDLGYGCRLFIPRTEYGGIIRDIESITSTNEVALRGYTWRGMLKYKIVEPPAGEGYLVLSGELNHVISELIGERFDDLFVVSGRSTGIMVTNWQVDRYVTLYDALEKLLDAYGCRLKIIYVEPEDLEYGYIEIQAEQIKDYSNELEYSTEGNVSVDIRDYRNGVNHLVCVGEGQEEERVVIHLYVQEDGSITKNQYYYGTDEITAVYNYSSADSEKLEEGGRKRLKELQNYKKCNMTVDDMDLELGDIVAGYDIITDTQVKQPVTQKVLKMQKGRVTIDYNIKGDD